MVNIIKKIKQQKGYVALRLAGIRNDATESNNVAVIDVIAIFPDANEQVMDTFIMELGDCVSLFEVVGANTATVTERTFTSYEKAD